ncbi:HAD-IA family hydrolase [Kibdelosporangium philippinense]|uniref:HAD-IA family hydrolase n=1 Tax=Kibdelosporangium philippinense TaxID=211113 RepID=A0ABS8Z924_9PSEU|nr:HAD-IA family hydrolase [Kibdelosporangium philippinense]MCE7004380.1 HAD-IA family hydrolase [Kibdelosporangium philippinense]
MSSPYWTDRRRRAFRRTAAVRARGGNDWLGLTTIVLDLGGVVVPTLFEVVDDDPTFPRGPFGADPLYDGVEQGKLQERDYWAALAAARPDLDIGRLMRTRIAVRAEVTAMLAQVGGRVRVVALTNDMAHWFGPQWMETFPEFARFDVLLEAAQSGVLKPDPAVFRWALAHLDEPAAKCLFVDDLPSNLAGATAVGMNVELFDVTDPAGSVRRILQRIGIPPSNGQNRVFRP